MKRHEANRISPWMGKNVSILNVYLMEGCYKTITID
jgi:hypothetical protein